MGMKGFKGFEKDFSCRGKQYEENTTYEENGTGCCHKGVMHFCEDPWEVLNHYDLVDGNGDFSEFAEVDARGQVWSDGDKRATDKLHIGAKLGFKGFIKACVDFTVERTKFDDLIGSSGNSAKIGSSGDYAKIGSSGNSAQINSTGEDAVIMCAGNESRAKAKKGSWITLAEWVEDEEKGRYVPVCVKTEYVDGEKIKEDTYYTLKSGEFVEVEE